MAEIGIRLLTLSISVYQQLVTHKVCFEALFNTQLQCVIHTCIASSSSSGVSREKYMDTISERRPSSPKILSMGTTFSFSYGCWPTCLFHLLNKLRREIVISKVYVQFVIFYHLFRHFFRSKFPFTGFNEMFNTILQQV